MYSCFSLVRFVFVLDATRSNTIRVQRTLLLIILMANNYNCTRGQATGIYSTTQNFSTLYVSLSPTMICSMTERKKNEANERKKEKKHSTKYTNEVKQALCTPRHTQYSFNADVLACRFVCDNRIFLTVVFAKHCGIVSYRVYIFCSCIEI